MRKIGQSLVVMLLGISSIAHANFDYFENNRQTIRNGVQAVLSCNGLFTSNRSIDQVFKSELAYLGDRVVGNSDAGELSLDAPLGFDWLPEATAADTDPRNKITLRHALHMSSGLYPVDSFGMEYATGSGLAYWAGASSIEGMRNRGLIREPGTFWDYENYDTLLAVYALKKTFKSPEAYLAYPHRALFEINLE